MNKKLIALLPAQRAIIKAYQRENPWATEEQDVIDALLLDWAMKNQDKVLVSDLFEKGKENENNQWTAF